MTRGEIGQRLQLRRRKIALKNAQDKIWALEGYALRERLAA